MTTLQPGTTQIFAFPSDAHRQAFIADLIIAGVTQWATNVDPDEEQAERFLVAVPTDQVGLVLTHRATADGLLKH